MKNDWRKDGKGGGNIVLWSNRQLATGNRLPVQMETAKQFFRFAVKPARPVSHTTIFFYF